jgi:hypothetical protein
MSTATAHRRKPVSRTDKRHVIDLPDTGYRFAPRCRDCWLAECWYVMTPARRKDFTTAMDAIRPFVRAPDRALAD